jgi:ribonuclease HII
LTLTKFFQHKLLEAGCDEAGRGCLAGPVYAAAVILDKNQRIKYLDDSKNLTHHQRNELRLEIEEKALAWAVASFTNNEIDKVNILKASFLSMHKAIDGLKVKPEHLIIDGNRFIPYPNIGHTCIIKGDAKFQSIAAASILAKTHRDEYMLKINDEYPNYFWHENKGYGTLKHRAAIEKFGISPYHRKTFRLLKNQLELF